MPGAYHRIAFARPDGGAFVEIETTRPELIPACVALVAHPDDERYQPLFGTEVVTPLFGVRVPVQAHALADPEKGSGIAMICTFGDITDVTWWRELQPAGARGHSARRHAARPSTWGAPGWESVDADARAAPLRRARAACRPRRRARRSSSSCARRGDLVGEPRPITHAVKFFEKGDRPLEIVTSRQWFIKTIEFREALLARGRELQWHPRVHAGALRELGQRPERRLVRQPPAVLRRAVPGLVSARRADGRLEYDQPIAAARGRSCRSIRRPTCPTATAPISAACPAASSAIPTSWTRGRPRR